MIQIDWSEKAEELAQVLPASCFDPRVVFLLETNREKAVGIACSGGADSLALLLLLYGHFPELRSRLTVLHMNHMLREEESDGDEKFVEEVSRELGLSFNAEAWSKVDLTKPVSENDARDARQRLYSRFIKEKGCGYVVMAHHMGDVLETLMLRIARGSNLQGLSAPRPVQVFDKQKTFLRPLLGLEKSDILKALEQCAVPWREDSSNQKNEFDRNRLRNEVIPSWQLATQYNLNKAAYRVSEYLDEAQRAIDSFVASSDLPKEYSKQHELPGELPLRAVLRRWFLQWAHAMEISSSLNPDLVNNILDTLYARARGRWSVGRYFIQISDCNLCLGKGMESAQHWTMLMDIENNSELRLPDGSNLSVRYLSNSDKLRKDLAVGKYSEMRTVLVNTGLLEGNSLIVRSWNHGDRYRPFNSPGSKKLQDMFTDRKIEREERSSLPVVTSKQGEILWCPKLPLNEIFRITPETNTILQLTYNSQS